MKQPAVYIIASQRNGTLYVGVTSNLIKRIYEHKEEVIQGFTKKYGPNLLVFYELHESMLSAISREKQIKGGSRQKKLNLIEAMNPDWRDLYEDIIKSCHSWIASSQAPRNDDPQYLLIS